MALSRTLIGSDAVADLGGAANITDTFDCGTVTAGDLLVFCLGGTKGQTAGQQDFTVAKSSGTATIGTVTQAVEGTSSFDYPGTSQINWCHVTGSGTLVIVYGNPGNSYGTDIHVFKYTGHDTTTPIGGTASAMDYSSGLPSTSTLSAAPGANDEVLQIANGDTDAASGKGWTAGTNFTEIVESTSSSSYQSTWVGRRAGSVSTSTTINNPTQDDTPHMYSVSMAAAVIKAAAGGGSPTGRPKYWNGSAWVQKPGKVWNGSAWVEKPTKVWNGSSWVTVT